MGKGSLTKIHVVETALNEAVSSGLGGLSFGTLANATGLSKSGLFAHFSSKEDLQKAVVEKAIALFIANVVALARRQKAGRDQLTALYSNHLDWIAGKRGLPGCPFVIFVQEFDDHNGDVRNALIMSQKLWRRALASAASVAQQNQQINRQAHPGQIAFELVGAALAFQVSHNLLRDRNTRDQALVAFNQIIN